VLAYPSIAPNTGAIIRLSANAGAHLHLVKPLGFSMEDSLLKRAGLDYHELANVTVHDSLDDAQATLVGRWSAFSAKASTAYTAVHYRHDDVLLFGNERNGLPADVMAQFPDERLLTIPMMPGNRSLNLANAVAIVVYEAWRQVEFSPAGPGAPTGG
jgi:tRNA (cytidine/uridine-2'-O-)-methyltransferase